jgi:hypothetical protein
MKIAEVIAELRVLNQQAQAPLRLPSEGDVTAAERLLDTKFPEDYRQYLLEAGDVVFGTLSPPLSCLMPAICIWLSSLSRRGPKWNCREISFRFARTTVTTIV